MIIELPTVEHLRSILSYDPDSGVLTWLRGGRWNRLAGKPAGSLCSNGYFYIRIEGVLYLSHRIIWKIVTGLDPGDEIDHENTQSSDNRWINLREATHDENMRNSSGKSRCGLPKGTYYTRNKKKVTASIYVERHRVYLGSFDTKEEASTAYRAAAIKHYADFARA